MNLLLQLCRKLSTVFRRRSWTKFSIAGDKKKMSTSLTAVELNYVVYRYLLESGLNHTAYTLGVEAGIDNPRIATGSIPRGALEDIVRMGLGFKEMQANTCYIMVLRLIQGNKGEDEEDFCSLLPMDLVKLDITVLQDFVMFELARRNKGKSPETSEVLVGDQGARMQNRKGGKGRRVSFLV